MARDARARALTPKAQHSYWQR